MAEGADFSKFIEPVARAMLQASHGEPNRLLSTKTELRFGKKGSLSIDLQKGTWHDHELDEGGGTLDLLKLYGNMEKHEAIEWLVEQGYVAPTERREKPVRREDKFLGFMEHHPEKIFVYHDERGRVAYEVLKFPRDAARRYMQRRPAPNAGGWIFGLQDGTYGKTNRASMSLDDRSRFLRELQLIRAGDDGSPIDGGLLPESVFRPRALARASR